jgi:hypothetical protein
VPEGGHGKADGKKKVMGRKTNSRFVEKVETYIRF